MNIFGNAESSKIEKRYNTDFDHDDMTHLFDNCDSLDGAEFNQFKTSPLVGATYYRFPEGLQEDDYNSYAIKIRDEMLVFVVNTDLEECREAALTKLNSEFNVHYEWFKEESGLQHWVLYNTEDYEVKSITHSHPNYYTANFLVAKHKEVYALPAGITHCYRMFTFIPNFTDLLEMFNYSRLEIDMEEAFLNCKDLEYVSLGKERAIGFFKVKNLASAFRGCEKLFTVDLRYVSFKNTKLSNTFYGCCILKYIFVNKFFNPDNISRGDNTFELCVSIPNFDCNHVFADKETLTLSKDGGYLSVRDGQPSASYLSIMDKLNNGNSIEERFTSVKEAITTANNDTDLTTKDKEDLKRRFGRYFEHGVPSFIGNMFADPDDPKLLTDLNLDENNHKE